MLHGVSCRVGRNYLTEGSLKYFISWKNICSNKEPDGVKRNKLVESIILKVFSRGLKYEIESEVGNYTEI
jgi:hypothetical protein